MYNHWKQHSNFCSETHADGSWTESTFTDTSMSTLYDAIPIIKVNL